MLQLIALLYHTGYIGEFEIIDDHRAGKIVVNLTGRLNKVNVLMDVSLLSKYLTEIPMGIYLEKFTVSMS